MTIKPICWNTARRPEGRPLTYRRDGSLLTPRWREMDSNHRSRALSYTVKAMSEALDHSAKATYSFATGDRWMPKARHTGRSTIRHAVDRAPRHRRRPPITFH